MFALPVDFDIPVWDALRLDAQGALPSVGTAIVLAATSLEVFISTLLDKLAAKKGVSEHLWTWITDRNGRILQQPSVEEQFDVLLREFSGHSLKEDAALWEAFRNLETARNTFVHEGTARVGSAAITKEEAGKLVMQVDSIIARVREWILEDIRWPISEVKVTVEGIHRLTDPSDKASEAGM